MKSYTIHLIRHGITEANLLGQYAGVTDTPLAEEGVRALQKLASEHSYPRAEVFYCSPLRRCRETLSILYPGVQPILVDDLRECNFGAWEAKTAGELAAEDENFLKWMEKGSNITPPGGESMLQFAHRVCAAFEKLVEGMLRSGVTSAVLMAHGGTLMSILSAYGLPRAKFYDWMTQNGCGYSMRITPGLWMRSMVAEVYGTVPAGVQARGGDEKFVLDIAREAADRAYGKGEE